MAIDFGRNLEISVVVRPGNVVRCPRLIARRSVETAGLNKAPCKKAARSILEVEASMVLQARLVVGVELGVAMVVLGGSGMFQRPLVLFRGPLMRMESSLMIWTWCFVRRAAQSLSQSWPREMREPVCNPGRM